MDRTLYQLEEKENEEEARESEETEVDVEVSKDPENPWDEFV